MWFNAFFEISMKLLHPRRQADSRNVKYKLQKKLLTFSKKVTFVLDRLKPHQLIAHEGDVKFLRSVPSMKIAIVIAFEMKEQLELFENFKQEEKTF